MRTQKILRTLLPLLLLLLALFAAGPALADCEVLQVRFDTRLQSPGSYLGNVSGDLNGAISFESISRQSTDLTDSVIRVTFVSPNNTDLFEAFLRTAPEPDLESFRQVISASGKIDEGEGRFVAGEWKLGITGFPTEETFRGEMALQHCR